MIVVVVVVLMLGEMLVEEWAGLMRGMEWNGTVISRAGSMESATMSMEGDGGVVEG